MKIFFIGQKGLPASYGGVEHHVEQIATRLAKKGHNVSVYCRPWYQEIINPHNPFLSKYEKVKLIHQPSIHTKNLDSISATFLNTLDVMTKKRILFIIMALDLLLFFFYLDFLS